MDNALRSAEHAELMFRRRADLVQQLQSILAGERRPVVWEIGCGHGHFLTAFAQAHPDRICIGIDVVGERVERAERKRVRAGLTNLHFIRAEARLFLATLPAGVRLAAVIILFPDPWPKLRHRKHRILQPDFLAALAERTADDGPLYFRTDHRPYFDAAAAVVAAEPRWQRVDEPWPFEFPTVFQNRAPSFHSLVARRRS